MSGRPLPRNIGQQKTRPLPDTPALPPSSGSVTDPVKSEDGHVGYAEPEIRFGHVARDVFIIFVLTFIGGFAVAVVMGGPSANE